LFSIYELQKTWDKCYTTATVYEKSFAEICIKQENEVVAEYMAGPVWIGGFQSTTDDESNGNWALLDGPHRINLTFSTWDSDQPDDVNGVEDNIVMKENGFWGDEKKQHTYSCLFIDPIITHKANSKYSIFLSWHF